MSKTTQLSPYWQEVEERVRQQRAFHQFRHDFYFAALKVRDEARRLYREPATPWASYREEEKAEVEFTVWNTVIGAMDFHKREGNDTTPAAILEDFTERVRKAGFLPDREAFHLEGIERVRALIVAIEAKQGADQ